MNLVCFLIQQCQSGEVTVRRSSSFIDYLPKLYVPWWRVVITSCLSSLSPAQGCGFSLSIMAPKRRRRASARKGAKKGGNMGGGIGMCRGGSYVFCIMRFDGGMIWICKMKV